MNKKGTLYLLPSPLGETGIHKAIPAYNIEVISRLKCFIVEEIRTARRFLKKACPQINIDELTFIVNNEHSKEADHQLCIEPLLNDQDTGLLSEAGIPCVADPGAGVVKVARENGIRVIPLAGASSILLALMASGFNGQNFAFHGYLPVDRKERIRKIKEIERAAYSSDQTQIFIETPYRNIQLLDALKMTCLDQTLLCIATDLTLETEQIDVRPVGRWKKGNPPDIHKRPAVFLIYR